MEITGTLSEFPLQNLLQLLDQRNATGCLVLSSSSNNCAESYPCTESYSYNHLIWFEHGHIISTQKGNHKKDIYTLAVREEMLSPFLVKRLREEAPEEIAAGLYLEEQGILDFDQLRSIFFSEVVCLIQSLCLQENAVFYFLSTTDLPRNAMTGFRIPASRVVILEFLSEVQPIKVAQSSQISKGHEIL
jgi:hypothetical protein